MADNRRNPRIACAFEAKMLGPRGTVRGTVKNISVGGLYLSSKDVLPVGTSVEAEITIEGKKLKATAEVRHHLRVNPEEPGMGLKFVRVDPAVLAAVQKLVEAALAAAGQSPA
jgi:uncharacterized protein (TIGR02266 family)